MPTVRENIIGAVIAGLEGIPGVGAVVPPGIRSDALAETIGSLVRGGQYVIELMLGNDEPEGDRSDTMGIERWRLPVGCYIHMPEPAPFVTPEPVGGPTRMRYHALASEVGAAIYALYRSSMIDPGRWEVDGVPQARATSPLGGGGVYIDPDLATNVTEHAFEISYAHTSGDPTDPR